MKAVVWVLDGFISKIGGKKKKRNKAIMKFSAKLKKTINYQLSII